jgi:hypothetical protein
VVAATIIFTPLNQVLSIAVAATHNVDKGRSATCTFLSQHRSCGNLTKLLTSKHNLVYSLFTTDVHRLHRGRYKSLQLNTKRNARISIMATKIMSRPTAIGLPQSPVWTPLTALRRIEVEQARLNAMRSILVPENFPIQQLAEHPINILTLKPDDRTHFYQVSRSASLPTATWSFARTPHPSIDGVFQDIARALADQAEGAPVPRIRQGRSRSYRIPPRCLNH